MKNWIITFITIALIAGFITFTCGSAEDQEAGSHMESDLRSMAR